MKKTFTFLVLSNTRQSTKKFVIPQNRLITLGLVGFFMALVGVAFTFDYAYLLYKDHQEAWLRSENETLKKQITQMETKLNSLEASFDRIDVFSRKLRTITQVENPQRELQLAIGPGVQTQSMPEFKQVRDVTSIDSLEQLNQVDVSGESGEMAVMGMRDYGSLSVRFDQVLKESKLREQSLLELWQNLSDRISLLGATPSIRPVNGWVTSNFGMRRSPFSNTKRMHHGLDIAASFGTPVVAPADGIVSYVGYDGGYGKLVSIDHGYGVVTRYGHNARIFVKVGQRVKRGDKVASVGNTGRSTGPHLHYEVRVNGIPVDPKKYILDQN
ncbi:MAG: M23 family metallopeptidase [Bdellovibrionales bacterium]|nr:M23 family metallopeptidase [Bdellovibrionales bacterium]NQZ17981.1 M23 family metallopeptidase [Bdellovibrionales bacterium]